jgi:hypothetical protein
VSLTIRATLSVMTVEISEADLQQLRQLSSELNMVLERLRPLVNPTLDALITARLNGMEQVSAAAVRLMFPGFGRAAVHASLERLGWVRYRNSRLRFWVRHPFARS